MNKRVKNLFIAIIILFGCFLIVKYFHPFGLEPWMIKKFIIKWSKKWFYFPVTDLMKSVLLKPYFFIALIFTLIMQKIMPAKKGQKMFSISFIQDLIWWVYETCLHAIILTTFVMWLRNIYNAHLTFLTIQAIGDMPGWLRFVWGVLVLDFLYWLQHYINHKVEWFWEMHTVHHSQKEINFFSDFRYHIIEYLVRHAILVIPLLIFTVDTPTIVWFSIIRVQYTHFYHGNIKTNLGPLRYILVTPQSHRIHHSIEPKHRDLNFGSIFTFWDFMFGTQYTGWEEYPDTGISDEEYPHEDYSTIPKMILMPVIQMYYPIRKIVKSFGKNSE